jgi:hypothetical protein
VRAAALAWSIAALAMALGAAGLVFSAIAAAPSGDHPDVHQLPAIALGMLAYVLVGAVIGSRRPGNAVGWILLAAGVAWELFVFGTGYAGYGTFVSAGLPAVAPIALATADGWLISGTLVGTLFMLFPDGRALSPRWRAAMWLMLVAIAAQILIRGLGSVVPNRTYLRNPLGSPGGDAFAASAIGVINSVWPAFLVLAVIALVVRFRRSSDLERKQLEWIASAATVQVGAVVLLQVVIVTPLHALDPSARVAGELFAGVPFAVSFCALPAAAALALFRYRLYDIDLVINRALVYGATTAGVGAAFFGGIAVLQALLRPFTSGSELAVAASTLASFLLFQPIRQRVQRAVDRRFYRSRYDAARTLDRFSGQLASEVDLSAVRTSLIGAVGDAVQPAHASVWLRERAR